MFFGLALFAGLIGYVFVDPFSNDEDSVEIGAEDDLTSQDLAISDGSNLLDSAAGTEDTETSNVATAEPIIPDVGAIIEGTDDDDLIYGGDANDVIFGGDGNYTINGGSGDDQLRGGDGSNTINGDEGDDKLFAGEGNVGQSSNTLNGGEGNDTLYGSTEPQNLLNGGAGDDEIHMHGQDIATGGEGDDRYYSSAENNNGIVSTITDYNAEEDQIIVEYPKDFAAAALDEPTISISSNGDDAIVSLDGEELIMVLGAANNLSVEDILLQAV